jgi:superfamily II DNA or RNA helicase
MCLKSFEIQSKLTHILLYTNTIEDANLSNEYINEILSLNIFPLFKKNIYNKSLHSKCNNLDLDNEINTFKNTPYGIISCIQIFGEGFDLPKLNGVCITGNMQSEVKIVQYLLRPHRLDPLNPNKKAYIIIPYFDADNLEIQNKSFQNIKNIISQLRNIDENIEQKISIYTIEKSQPEKDKDYKQIQNNNINFINNVDELNKIKLRLRHSKVLESKCSEEQDEYNYVRELNKELNIQSKNEYNDKVIKDKHQNYIEKPDEYFKLKGVWDNWYDFLGIDTKKFIQNKQEWLNFIEKNNIKSVDDYNILCTKCDVLPKEPAEFYIGFGNIYSLLNSTSRRR